MKIDRMLLFLTIGCALLTGCTPGSIITIANNLSDDHTIHPDTVTKDGIWIEASAGVSEFTDVHSAADIPYADGEGIYQYGYHFSSSYTASNEGVTLHYQQVSDR